jgi:hypothetical protein
MSCAGPLAVPIANLLLRFYANVLFKYNQGNTALFYAVRDESYALAQMGIPYKRGEKDQVVITARSKPQHSRLWLFSFHGLATGNSQSRSGSPRWC